MTSPNNNIKEYGHQAAHPGDIPKKGWIEILRRVKDQIKLDHVMVVSAGVAFYFFLALFPAIAAIFSIYGLVVDPAQVEQQMKQMADALPAQAYQLVSDMLEQTAGKSKGDLGWGLILSILFSLWSANKATTAVFEGINIAYHEMDDRSFLRKKIMTLLFTLGSIVIGIISIGLVVAFPAIIGKLRLPPVLQTVFALLRWVFLATVVFFVLGMFYKIAPNRANPKFRWIKPGAAMATFLWLAGSWLFSLYVNNFGHFDATYGSITAVIIFMLWFFLTGFIIILGAEINSEIEHQTEVDTTVGKKKPMGERGAYYADNKACSANKTR